MNISRAKLITLFLILAPHPVFSILVGGTNIDQVTQTRKTDIIPNFSLSLIPTNVITEVRDCFLVDVVFYSLWHSQDLAEKAFNKYFFGEINNYAKSEICLNTEFSISQ